VNGAGTTTSEAGQPRSGRRLDSRGAVLVEAALVTPVVILVMMAIVDGGMLMLTLLSTDEVVGDGSRSAIVLRDEEDADARILDAIEPRLTGLRRSQVERIVIYRATGPDADPPTACTTGPVSSSAADECSAYAPADFDKNWGDLDCGWCPSDRNEGDYIGVWVRLNYDSVTGLMGRATMTDRQVRMIEPDL
jgi:hypothetical protein